MQTMEDGDETPTVSKTMEEIAEQDLKKDPNSDTEAKQGNRASSELMVEEEQKEEGDIELSMCADILPNCENED